MLSLLAKLFGRQNKISQIVEIVGLEGYPETPITERSSEYEQLEAMAQFVAGYWMTTFRYTEIGQAAIARIDTLEMVDEMKQIAYTKAALVTLQDAFCWTDEELATSAMCLGVAQHNMPSADRALKGLVIRAYQRGVRLRGNLTTGADIGDIIRISDQL